MKDWMTLKVFETDSAKIAKRDHRASGRGSRW